MNRDRFGTLVWTAAVFALALVMTCVVAFAGIRLDCHERCGGSFVLHVGLTSQSCRCMP